MTEGKRLVIVGLIAGAISTGGTYLYFVSVYLIPLLVVLMWLAIRSYRRLEEPRSPSARLSLGLGLGAVVAPLAGLLTFLSDWWKPYEKSGWTGHAMFFVMASVVAVLLLAVSITFGLTSARARRVGPA